MFPNSECCGAKAEMNEATSSEKPGEGWRYNVTIDTKSDRRAESMTKLSGLNRDRSTYSDISLPHCWE